MTDVLTCENINVEPSWLHSLTPWQWEVARLLASGYSPAQISVQTGISLREILDLTHDPIFRKSAQDVGKDLHHSATELRLRMELAAQDALDTIIDLMHTSRSDIVKRLCATDIIDRAGYGITQQIDMRQTVVIDDARAELIATAIKETNV